MGAIRFVLLSALVAVCSCQRSPYAGRRPIGFPLIETTTSVNTQNNTLGNRVGESENATTQRLPIEAQGDRELVNRLGKLPQDNQPFWFLNWQALEENRKRPQSYPQRPNIFAESLFFTNDDVESDGQISNNEPFTNSQRPTNIRVPSNNNEKRTRIQTVF